MAYFNGKEILLVGLKGEPGPSGDRDSLEYIKSKNVFYYYSDIQAAITDMHNNTHDNGENIQNNSANCATYYDHESERWVLVLLADITLPTTTTLFKIPVEINFAGKFLTFPDIGLGFWGFQNEAYLNGKIGGGIRALAVTQSSSVSPLRFATTTKNVVVDGGEYIINGQTTSDGYMHALDVRAKNIEIRNVTVDVTRDGDGEYTYGVQVYKADNVTLDNSVIKVKDSDTGTTKNILGAYVREVNFNANISNCEIVAEASDWGSIVDGIASHTVTTLTLTDNNVKVDSANNEQSKGSYGYAVRLLDTVDKCFINGGTYIGMQTAVSTSAPVFVKGGKFVSCSHGGFYIHHENKSSYIQDAIIGCEEYSGKFDRTQMGYPDKSLGAFYIGSGNFTKVYMDGCSFVYNHGTADEDTEFPCGVVRGTDAERNNHLYISNIQLPDIEGSLRLDKGNYLHIGADTNFTIDHVGLYSSVGKGEVIYEENRRYRYEDQYANDLLDSDSATEVKNRHRDVYPMVTFFDDDGRAEVWEKLKPLSETYNIPFVLAIPTGLMDDDPGRYLRLSQLKDLQAMGWEISSHTVNHVELGSTENPLTDEQQEAEIRGSKEYFDANGLNVTTICYPFGSQTENTHKITKKYFKAARVTNWKDWTNTSPLETWDMRCTPLGSYFTWNSESGLDTSTLEYYKWLVDEAVKNNAWLMFLTHCGAEAHTDVQQGYLEETIKYVQSLNIPIVTFSEGLARRGNIVDVGRYNKREASIKKYRGSGDEYYVVGCDGKAEKSDHDTYMIKLPINSVTNATPPKDFPVYVISACRITGTSGGFPLQGYMGGGTLITNKLGENHDVHNEGRVWQEFVLQKGTVPYKRYALSDTEWSEWGYGDTMLLSPDSKTIDDPVSEFPRGAKSKVWLTQTTGNATRLPDDSGYLVTDRTDVAAKYITQTFYPRPGSIKTSIYMRWWTGSAWTDWNSMGEHAGSTNYRSWSTTPKYVGMSIFDTDLKKPVWWNGSAWVNATGATGDSEDASSSIEILPTMGDSETSVMSQKAVSEAFDAVDDRLLVMDGKFAPKFEIGRIDVADGALSYTTSKINIRTVDGELYKVPSGSTFSLSDYTNASLLVYYSYDDGNTFASISRKATNTAPIVMSQDAYIAIVIQSATNTVQTDASLSELLVVDINTVVDKVIEPNLNNVGLWEMGQFNMTTGSGVVATDKARMTGYIHDTVEKINLNGYVTRLLAWDADGAYIGYWDGTSFQTTNSSLALDREINIKAFREIYPMYKFRLVANMASVVEAERIEFYGKIYSALYDSKTRRPMVTFIDDDGWAEAIDNWVEIANETGIKPTFAIVTNTVDSDDRITWERMKCLANRGFEFISHTHTHIRSTDATDEELENEYLTSINAFNDHGLRCEFLAYPYNAYNLRVMNIAKKYFTGAVTNGNVENYLPLVPFGLYRHAITDNVLASKTFEDGTTRDVYGYRTEEDLCAVIDAAVENNGWVIFMSHCRDRDTFYYNDEIKQMIINLIKHAAKSGCEIVTLKEGYEAYKNRLDNGVYKWDSNYLIVDRDGRIYEK